MALTDYGFSADYKPLPQTQVQEKLLQQQLGQQQNDQQTALDRKFAQLGGGPSGASIKASQQLGDQTANNLEKGTLQLYAQDLPIQQQMAEAQKNRDFTQAQTLQGQQFTKDLTREQQTFQSAEAQKGRDFTGQQFDQDLAFKNKVNDADQSAKLRELDLGEQQFAEDKKTTEFNKLMTTLQAPDHGGKLWAIVKDPNYSDATRSAALMYINTDPHMGNFEKGFQFNATTGELVRPKDAQGKDAFNVWAPNNFFRG